MSVLWVKHGFAENCYFSQPFRLLENCLSSIFAPNRMRIRKKKPRKNKWQMQTYRIWEHWFLFLFLDLIYLYMIFFLSCRLFFFLLSDDSVASNGVIPLHLRLFFDCSFCLQFMLKRKFWRLFSFWMLQISAVEEPPAIVLCKGRNAKTTGTLNWWTSRHHSDGIKTPGGN